MTLMSDVWEERASNAISKRNRLVKEGRDPNSKGINQLEENASYYLSLAGGRERDIEVRI